MVDNKSIGGALATGLLARISEVTKDDLTLYIAIGVGLTTIFYNCLKIYNELKHKQ